MVSDSQTGSQLRLRVVGVGGDQIAPGTVRVSPSDLHRLGAALGDVVAVNGERRTYARVMRTYARDPGHGLVYLSLSVSENSGAGPGMQVALDRVDAEFARQVRFRVLGGGIHPVADDLRQILLGLAITAEDTVTVDAASGLGGDVSLRVEATEPDGPAIITTETEMILQAARPAGATAGPTYADVGGLGPQLERIREVVELPLRHPEIFEHLGIGAPRGILLHGPPGTGKTLIARAIAAQTSAHFLHVSGPEIIHRYYGDSEAHLRQIFEEARKQAPTIVFFDELDAIAPKREDVAGEVEKRVVAQLMALLDGLDSRGQVIVLAATNVPDALDPALRRPGRFDRELAIPVPDAAGRAEILRVHTRRMPLANDVDLDQLAAETPGYVGADLEALCREAALCALHVAWQGDGTHLESLAPEQLRSLTVSAADFALARTRLQPSTTREWGSPPSVRGWDAVAGLAAVKQELREAVEWPLREAEALSHFSLPAVHALLLCGPPGTGKSLLARTVARATGANLLEVPGARVLSKWVGESEKAIGDIFRQARRAAPSVVVFDDIETLAPNRASGHMSDSAGRLTGQIAAEIARLDASSSVLVLATTARPDLLDPALLGPGRFERQIVIPLPDAVDRLAILQLHASDRPLAASVDLALVARATEGLSGAALAALLDDAAREAMRDYLAGNRPLARRQILWRHVLAAADRQGIQLSGHRAKSAGGPAAGR